VIVVGVSSGTSVDAIDTAVADLGLAADGTLTLRPLGHSEHPWPAGLRERLLAALPPAPVGVAEWCALDTLVGQALGDAARRAVEEHAGGRADLAASHGQTLFHWVAGGAARGTLQVGQPAWIAERSGLPVVSDLRAGDVAAGGQGAPLVSVLDALWLGETDGAAGGAPRRRTAALNIGGIANITVVGRADEPVLAWDTGPGNCLVDAAVQRLTGRPYDRDGELAAAGSVDPAALAVLLDDPYYDLPVPRSTGRELFDAGYAAARLAPGAPAGASRRLDGPDLVATLTELTAVTIARSLARDAGPGAPVGRVVVSGGGAHNPVLLARLRAHLAEHVPGAELVTADALGLPGDAKEAYLFALLGYLSVHGLPGTAAGRDGTRATGARRPVVLGSLTPPAPLAVAAAAPAVRRLVVAPPPGAPATAPGSRPPGTTAPGTAAPGTAAARRTAADAPPVTAPEGPRP
jgi:anhydro-N-acetylmuramic acid kinase